MRQVFVYHAQIGVRLFEREEFSLSIILFVIISIFLGIWDGDDEEVYEFVVCTI